jgi:hypothetical protein
MPTMPSLPTSAAPEDDLVAAALAAVALYTEAADAPSPPAARPAWRTAALLAAQGVAPARSPAVTWATAERAGRAGRWSAGILGSFD